MKSNIDRWIATVETARNEGSGYLRFADIAFAGERLRRWLGGAPEGEEQVEGAWAALTVYDRFLSKVSSVPAVEVLDSEMSQEIAALAAFAGEARIRRDASAGLHIVGRIDRILCAATAAWRVGLLARSDLVGFAGRAREAAERVAPELGDLWTEVDGAFAAFGPDPDVPETATWTEPIARLSAERVALERALQRNSEARRERVIDAVLDRLMPASTEPVPWFASLRGWLSTLVDLSFALPAPRLSFESEATGPPEVRIIAADPDATLAILLSVGQETTLLVQASSDHELRPRAACLDDETVLALTQTDNHTVCVTLPGGMRAGRVCISVDIDGHLLEIPPIAFG